MLDVPSFPTFLKMGSPFTVHSHAQTYFNTYTYTEQDSLLLEGAPAFTTSGTLFAGLSNSPGRGARLQLPFRDASVQSLVLPSSLVQSPPATSPSNHRSWVRADPSLFSVFFCRRQPLLFGLGFDSDRFPSLVLGHRHSADAGLIRPPVEFCCPSLSLA